MSTRITKTCPVCTTEFSVPQCRAHQRCCSNSCHSSREWKKAKRYSPRRVKACLNRVKAMWCLNCGWDEANSDLHHIRGRKIENADTCSNITLICPNCHRLVHEGKLDILTLKTLAQHLEESGLSYLNV